MLKRKLIVEHIFTDGFNKLNGHKNSNLFGSQSVCSCCSRWMTLRAYCSALAHNGKVRCTHFDAFNNLCSNTPRLADVQWSLLKADILIATLIWDIYRICYCCFGRDCFGNECDHFQCLTISLHRYPQHVWMCSYLCVCASNQIRLNKNKIKNKCGIFKGKTNNMFSINNARSWISFSIPY